MADDSLDDFFAKKDKSKKKGKAKVTPGDILAKQEEKPKKKTKKPKEEKQGGQETSSEDRPEKESKTPKTAVMTQLFHESSKLKYKSEW